MVIKIADKLPNMHSTTFQGLPVVIEWPKGSERIGTDKDGKHWKRKMLCDYGYIDDTEARGDEEPLDIYIGPDQDSPYVYAVEQLDDNGDFDEWKMMLGFSSLEDAEAMYLAHYPDGWEETHVGDIEEIPFKHLFDMAKRNQEEVTGESKTAADEDEKRSFTMPLKDFVDKLPSTPGYEPPDQPMAELYRQLREVYDNYPEYNDPMYGGKGFDAMVELFAKDDFYKLHEVAKRYLQLLNDVHVAAKKIKVLRSALEQARKQWQQTAQENNWGMDKVFIQCWVRPDGTITDSVSFKQLTQDVFLLDDPAFDGDEWGSRTDKVVPVEIIDNHTADSHIIDDLFRYIRLDVRDESTGISVLAYDMDGRIGHLHLQVSQIDPEALRIADLLVYSDKSTKHVDTGVEEMMLDAAVQRAKKRRYKRIYTPYEDSTLLTPEVFQKLKKKYHMTRDGKRYVLKVAATAPRMQQQPQAKSERLIYMWPQGYCAPRVMQGGQADHHLFMTSTKAYPQPVPRQYYDEAYRGYATVSPEEKTITVQPSGNTLPYLQQVPQQVIDVFKKRFPNYQISVQKSQWASAGPDDSYWYEALRQVGGGKRYDELSRDEQTKTFALAQKLKEQGRAKTAGKKGGDTAIWKGKPFWSGAVSTIDGEIEEVHTYAEASAADWHHSMYFSEAALDRMDDDESAFFCVQEDGTVWVDVIGRSGLEEEQKLDLVQTIKQQITITAK